MSVIATLLQTLNSLKPSTSCADNSNQPEQETFETSERIHIFSCLPTLAANIGPVETREKLIPTLSEIVTSAIDAGDDEVLMVISQKLESFAELVGGKEHGACLIPILERVICGVEEIVVTKAACDSLVTIVKGLPPDVVEDKCMRLIRRVLEEDLYCASRKVITKLISTCYPMVSAKLQGDLKYRIVHLADSDDEIPLVRSAAIQETAELAKLIGQGLKTELCLLLTSLIGDNQRIVRAACVGPLIELGRLVADATEFDASVQPCLDKLATDTSRDTRRALASNITELQRVACSFPGTQRSLHAIMISLLEDNEVETRRMATSQLKEFCMASPEEVMIKTLLPQLREHLNMEREESVRAELVRCAVSLLPSIRREDSLPLVQHILAFLNDADSQSKLYVFEHFVGLVSLVPPPEIELILLPSLLRLWQDKNWRVRLGVVQSIPSLYASLSETCAHETVLPANLAWLRDPSWYVRECACRSMARLLQVYPSLCKEAIHGVLPKQSAGATAAAPASPASTNSVGQSAPTASATQPAANTSTTSSSSSSNSTGASPGGSTPASPLQSATAGAPDGTSTAAAGTSSSPNALVNSTATSVFLLTAQAATGGLKALACDENYHLRQIYITVVQTVWGPGIPDEAPYSATGDNVSLGLSLPGLENAFAAVQASTTNAQSTPSGKAGAVPESCQPPPQLPAVHLTTCVATLMRLASDDKVANVRICAVRALQLISRAMDAKYMQKEVIPVLRKVVENDSDADVRFYAQETLELLT